MGIVNALKNAFNVRKSLGVDQLKRQTDDLKSIAKEFITPEKPHYNESFEQAMARLKLTEQTIQQRQREMHRLILIYSCLSIGLIIYIGYLLYLKAFLASLGCIGILLVLIGQMFRYHFWLYQIRHRRLGCTFREWFRSLLGVKS